MKKIINLTLGVPTKNSSKFIKKLFKSISEQSCVPKEILFIDDCSHDSTVSIIKDYAKRNSTLNIKVLDNTNTLGIAKNYNKIVRLSTSPWVQILDADDYLIDNFYEIIWPYLDEDYGVIITGVTSNVVVFDALNKLSVILGRNIPGWMPILGGLATRSGLIYKRKLLLKYNFPEPYFDGSDILHLIRIRKEAKSVFLRNAKIFYRIHPNSASNMNRNSEKYLYHINRLSKYYLIFYIDYFIRKKLFAFIRLLTS